MAAPSATTSASSAKLPTLSYADRAKMAAASAASSSSRSRSTTSTTTSNAGTQTGTETNSPSSSAGNITPSSSVILTRPGTPPQAAPPKINGTDQPPPKSPVKPVPPPNVWAARKEQMAQAQRSQPSTRPQPQLQPIATTENTPTASSSNATSPVFQTVNKRASHTRQPLNGIANHETSAVSPKAREEPLATTNTNLTAPPSIDDAKSWPEMGKPVQPTPSESEKKEAVVGNSRKGEFVASVCFFLTTLHTVTPDERISVVYTYTIVAVPQHG
ncbi:hypothetical protein BD410DRAFT_838102 [Rickenella mellea]|uniref:Uncharacterized protein n=1 Tax=Rickenella mellea TaxID=50990 RepID=A0A4Y7QB37_9AGAM|nr:hypothetical protein BD410DRAFT_838102 [Rickenella mellea]